MPRGLVSEKMTQTHFSLPSAQPLQGAYYSYTGRATTCQERTAFPKIPQNGSTKGSACNAGDLGSISGSGRSPGGGMAIHSSILAWRIPMDRGACGPQSMGSQSRTWLSWVSAQTCMVSSRYPHLASLHIVAEGGRRLTPPGPLPKSRGWPELPIPKRKKETQVTTSVPAVDSSRDPVQISSALGRLTQESSHWNTGEASPSPHQAQVSAPQLHGQQQLGSGRSPRGSRRTK